MKKTNDVFRFNFRKNIVKKFVLFLCFALLFTTSFAINKNEVVYADTGTLQVGDPGVTFDQSKFDSDYPQMEEWVTAGVRGGIPFIDQLNIKRTLTATNSAGITQAINEVYNEGGGAILLQNGTYNIDRQVDLKSNVCLVGESRDGVICLIDEDIDENNEGINPNDPSTAWDDGNGAFKFGDGVQYSGLYRMTIKGGWGTPRYDWFFGNVNNDELPGNENISVWFIGATDCWIDEVTILNSADFPVRSSGDHITMRNLYVDGCFNKHGGCHGYFFLLDGSKHNLVTGCYITHLRHISLQGSGVRYNVLYDNDIEQEISFHSHDDGDNLIENNRITLPADMPNGNPDYNAIMGPWSVQHEISTRPNYLYKNQCLERNHNNATPWSDTDKIYYGPHEVKPSNPYNNFTPLPNNKIPVGGTLYPIILGESVEVTGVSVSPASISIEVYETAQLTETVSPSNASNKSVTWSSSNSSVAAVNSNGEITGVSEGNATVTVTTNDGGYTASCNVTVTPSTTTEFNLNAVNDAYLQGSKCYNTNELRIEQGNRVSYLMFDLSGINGNIASAELKLSVGGDAGNGALKVEKGDNNNWTETNLSTSNVPASSCLLGSLNSSYSKGQTYTWELDETSIPSGELLSLVVSQTSGNDVSFASDENSNSSLRPVLTITTANDQIPVEGVSVSPENLSLNVGQTSTLTKTVYPSNATDKSVTWVSSSPSVADVNSNGIVTAVSEGNAVITVITNDGGYTDTCEVTVSEQQQIEYIETFENMTLVGWGTETYTGDNGFVWNVNAKGVSGYINSSKNIYFQGGITGVVSNPIPGGISSFSVTCLDKWDSGSERTIQLLVNGNVVGSMTHTGTEVYTFEVDNINISGNVTIAVKNASSSTTNNTIAIDNIEWTTFN